jgi:hypothetical protein
MIEYGGIDLTAQPSYHPCIFSPPQRIVVFGEGEHERLFVAFICLSNFAIKMD